MEEDIKMLEWSQQQMRLGNLPDYNQKVYKAIENLINRNKELEEENRIQRGQLNSAFDRGFVHKDKLREKIEEVNKSNGFSPVNKIFVEQVLQELLED